jgi:hypothetical protein
MESSNDTPIDPDIQAINASILEERRLSSIFQLATRWGSGNDLALTQARLIGLEKKRDRLTKPPVQPEEPPAVKAD